MVIQVGTGWLWVESNGVVEMSGTRNCGKVLNLTTLSFCPAEKGIADYSKVPIVV